MEEHQKERRKRAIKVALTEILMFFTVILLVIFLTLIVLGYNFNIKKIGTEEAIERVGLVQITSIPSGATVSIDGEAGDLFSRTTFSKTISVGAHTIKLTRDGYDSWTREIEVSEGLLYRVGYPRLFLKKRIREEILTLDAGEEAEFSENGKKLVVRGTDIEAGETKESYLELNDGKPVLKETTKETTLEEVEKLEEEEEKERVEKVRAKLKFGEETEIEHGEYLGEGYYVVLDKEEKAIVIYKGDPEADGLKKFFKEEFEFLPEEISVRGKGELVVVKGEGREAIYDFETGKVKEVEVEAGEKWLDGFMKYIVSDGKIIVKDFDGGNRRTLVSVEEDKESEEDEEGKVELPEGFGVKISANNKYLYYFIREAGTVKLVREKIL
ncbi:PEGA domain-containing protein [Candidatus Saccharibacteria bacterium]|nr:PEGA domain-containing protein [Candidatus Saccharibacteria bacterium]